MRTIVDALRRAMRALEETLREAGRGFAGPVPEPVPVRIREDQRL